MQIDIYFTQLKKEKVTQIKAYEGTQLIGK